MKWAIPADSLLKCQSGTLPPPPFTELNISLCQNKLGDPQIFFSSPLTSMRRRAPGRRAGGEREGARTDSSVQFTWKRPDTLQDWILILATLTILSGRQERQQPACYRPSPFPITLGGCSFPKHPAMSFENKLLGLIKGHKSKHVISLFTSIFTYAIFFLFLLLPSLVSPLRRLNFNRRLAQCSNGDRWATAILF